jgi:hypothetical protein
MRAHRPIAVAALLLIAVTLSASVRDLQIYGIVERVDFEPNEKTPQRVKVWGSFAILYTNQTPVTTSTGGPYSPHRGYLYFNLPADKPAQQIARKEWADLKAVAGTGQAVMFGSWKSAYMGTRSGDRRNGFVSVSGKESLRVYEKENGPPITYTMDTGIVKLQSQGTYAALVEQLKASLRN